jgi:hypothetical protein
LKKLATFIVLVPLLTGCATMSRPRVQWGMGIGGVAGAIGGAALSPNDASRGWNAVVFGAVGTALGGLIGYLSEPKPSGQAEAPSLKARELAPVAPSKEVEIATPEGLPGFVRERLQPVVIEEYVEPDTVSPDGTLHEPHKVYRIKKPAELFARPVGKEPAQEAQP